jgi:hypothetical protein
VTWWRDLMASRRFRPQTVESARQASPLELDEAVRDWVQHAYDPAETARPLEETALGRLRAQPERSVGALSEAYGRAPEEDYDLRSALVYCAGAMGTRAALGFLARVVEAEIPPERSNDIHHFSTRAEETSLRLQAVRGIEALASSGEGEARSLLLEQLAHPSYAVQVIALQALRQLPEQRRLADDELRRRLPADRVDEMVAVRRVSVEGLGTLVEGTATTRSPRPPGGESGVDFDARDADPPRASGAEKRNG